MIHHGPMKNVPITVFVFLLFFAPLNAMSQDKGEIIKRGNAKSPVWLGVQLLPDLSNEPGARVSGVMRNSPTDGIGIRSGDRIVEFEKVKISGAASLQKITNQYRDGDKVEIKFRRITTIRKATITLRSMPDSETIIRQHLVGEKAPKLSFQSAGKTKTLSSTTGTITVVDFWATWCSPCRETDKQLEKTKELFGDAISIISLSTESQKTVNSFLKKFPKKGMVVGIDHNEESEKLWHIAAYPTVVLLDQKQNIVSIMFGVNEVTLLNARIKKLLQN